MGDLADPWITANPRIASYSNYQLYVLSIYWIFTLVTTAGYGDLFGRTKGEYIITVVLMFGGVIVFGIIFFLVNKINEGEYNFEVCINEKFT